MSSALDKVSHAAQRKAGEVLVDAMLKNLNKDRDKAFQDIINLAEQFWGDGFTKEQYDMVREAMKNGDSKWMKFLNRVLDETDPNVAKMTLLNLGYEAFIRGTKMIRKNREK